MESTEAGMHLLCLRMVKSPGLHERSMSQETVDRIIALLKARGIPHKLSVHEPVRTSEEAARVRGVPLASGVKALVCKVKPAGRGQGPASGPERFVLVLAKGDEQADLKAVAAAEGTRKLSLASAEDVLRLTECDPGAVPPFGFAQPLPTYFDVRIRSQEQVNFNIGLKTHSVTMPERGLEEVLGDVIEY